MSIANQQLSCSLNVTLRPKTSVSGLAYEKDGNRLWAVGDGLNPPLHPCTSALCFPHQHFTAEHADTGSVTHSPARTTPRAARDITRARIKSIAIIQPILSLPPVQPRRGSAPIILSRIPLTLPAFVTSPGVVVKLNPDRLAQDPVYSVPLYNEVRSCPLSFSPTSHTFSPAPPRLLVPCTRCLSHLYCCCCGPTPHSPPPP